MPGSAMVPGMKLSEVWEMAWRLGDHPRVLCGGQLEMPDSVPVVLKFHPEGS